MYLASPRWDVGGTAWKVVTPFLGSSWAFLFLEGVPLLLHARDAVSKLLEVVRSNWHVEMVRQALGRDAVYLVGSSKFSPISRQRRPS